ncbi:MAG: fluoride efflux transporter CrcB [Marinoscillum sp.]
MKGILFVGFGGFIGSISRYLIGEFVIKNGSHLPLGTLTVNLAGSFLIGILAAWLLKSGHQQSYFLLATGFCGGFTTFSTFSLESLKLLKDAQYSQYAIYLTISVLGGLILCLFGYWLAQKLT